MKLAAEIEHPEVRDFARRAQAFVEGFGWCERVTACRLAFAVAGILGIFRIDLVPAGTGADPIVWAVVGDLPPAYLAFDEGDTWQDALRGYVAEVGAWVEAVRTGVSLQDVIPVNAPPTPSYADELEGRLRFLRAKFLEVDPRSVESDT